MARASRVRGTLVLVAVGAATSVSSLEGARAAGGLSWDQRTFAATVMAGTSVNVRVGFHWTDADTLVDPELVVTGPAAAAFTPDLAGTTAEGNDGYTIPVRIDVGLDARPVLPGALRLTDRGRNVGPALPVRLTIQAASADHIPSEPTDPELDRIATTATGIDVVGDEILVGVAFEAGDPDGVARAVAAATGGVFTGSVPSLRLYQLRFAPSPLAGLDAKIAQAEAVPGVAFASLNYVDQNLDTAIPNDPEWDDWNVADPGGDNWNLEWIDAPGAWDVTTGSSEIGVAVIDVGNDEDHPDLDDNISRADRNGPDSHGTHVAGIACAEGNNETGVTGVAWDCDLRFYAAGQSMAVTAGMMAEAVDDGARVANLSLNYIENGNCDIDETSLAAAAAEANDVFGQAVIYGDRVGAEILWVIGAGNDCGRNALYTAPGGLAARFPTNTVTVAAIAANGELAPFSNGGEHVAVAAPGVRILSTIARTNCVLGVVCEFDYNIKSGTSMAAPHVSGLAALVLADDPSRTSAEVKSCIVGGARLAGTPVAGQPFHTIDARAAVECDGLLDLPAQVDLVLALDLTGSMGSVLEQAKEETAELISSLAARAPLTDFRFALVTYEDYPGSFDSTGCGSTYVAQYGEAGDVPFELVSPLSGDAATTVAAVNGRALRSGFDGPESYGRMLWELAQPDTGAALGWRPDALRLVVNVSDDVPHDLNINQGVVGGTLAPDTGVDPGRDNAACTDDDIDFQGDALAQLAEQRIHLLHVDSNTSDRNLEPYWRYWTSLTEGAYVKLGANLTDTIVELLALL